MRASIDFRKQLIFYQNVQARVLEQDQGLNRSHCNWTVAVGG
jgi:hypothetical protein